MVLQCAYVSSGLNAHVVFTLELTNCGICRALVEGIVAFVIIGVRAPVQRVFGRANRRTIRREVRERDGGRLVMKRLFWSAVRNFRWLRDR